MRNLFLIFTFVFASYLGQSAFAHRLNSAFTIIEINPNKSSAQITHKIYAHDLEHSLSLHDAPLSYFGTKEGQEIARKYVNNNFLLKYSDGGSVTQSFIGAELEGDILYVYFEAKLAKNKEILLDSNLLQDMSKNQINYVNIHYKGKVQTLIFNKTQSLTKLRLAK